MIHVLITVLGWMMSSSEIAQLHSEKTNNKRQGYDSEAKVLVA